MAKDTINHRDHVLSRTEYQASLKDVIKYGKIPEDFLSVVVMGELYMTAKDQDLDGSRSVKLYRVSALIAETQACLAESLDQVRELEQKLDALKSFK